MQNRLVKQTTHPILDSDYNLVRKSYLYCGGGGGGRAPPIGGGGGIPPNGRPCGGGAP